MLAEREVLISILKLTKDRSARFGDIARDARVLSQVARQVLKKERELGVVQLDGNSVRADAEQRLKLAAMAIESGADMERVCKLLSWKEFEDLAILAFEANDFAVKKHFRFSWSGGRWEIDILGLKEPIVASVDCKQWHRGWRGSASRKAAEKQAQRTASLAKASAAMGEKLGIGDWKEAHFVPIILSLMPGALKFHKGLPIVPVLGLRDFLQKLPGYLDNIPYFRAPRGHEGSFRGSQRLAEG